MMDIDEETFSTLPPAEQDKVMREWLGEFSRNELLVIKHLIEQNRPCAKDIKGMPNVFK